MEPCRYSGARDGIKSPYENVGGVINWKDLPS